MSNKAYGIDVSKWQGKIDWPKVKAQGFAYAFIKATEREWLDPCFQSHWAGARHAGILRGAYHFFRFEVEAGLQADTFLQTLGNDPGEMPPVLDVEAAGSGTMDAATRVRRVEAWLRQVETALQRRPIIYTGVSKWKDLMLDLNGHYPAWSQDYALWLAQYPFDNAPVLPPQADYETFSTHLLPPTWSWAKDFPWQTWHFWQYTERGRVEGISNTDGYRCNVDYDMFNGSLEELYQWLKRPLPPIPAPEKEPVPVKPAPEKPAPVKPVPEKPAFLNQVMINAFHNTFGDDYWDKKVVPAGLTSMAIPAENRQKPYAGPPIQEMPHLSESEKAALQAALDQLRASA